MANAAVAAALIGEGKGKGGGADGKGVQTTQDGQPLCYNCGRPGHFIAQCTEKPRHGFKASGKGKGKGKAKAGAEPATQGGDGS